GLLEFDVEGPVRAGGVLEHRRHPDDIHVAAPEPGGEPGEPRDQGRPGRGVAEEERPGDEPIPPEVSETVPIVGEKEVLRNDPLAQPLGGPIQLPMFDLSKPFVHLSFPLRSSKQLAGVG
ncbi:MAG: hypothetical protein QOJ69_2126, partial [Actinomycetota bacterium]|nr:hypothetical protein [Actinomycetota bacterium]